MRKSCMVPLIALILVAVSCEKTRADYRDDIAAAVCSELQQCQKIGPDGKFANLDDCRTELSSRYNKMWSAKKCEQKIDPKKFQMCKSRATTNACSGNILDDVSFRLECGANDVCIADPPPEP